MGRVQGKVAIVTGGASGLGQADGVALAREGARVVLTDIDEKAGRDAAAAIGPNATFMKHDVTSEDDWSRVIADTMDQHGRLDILVNNAGIVIVATPEDTTLDQFRRANAVMSEGVFLGCRAAIPEMRKGGGGSIINMSSVASHLGYPVFFAYSAAKGAVRAMTKSIAVHCQMVGDRIRCNSIHAGAIDTPMVAKATEAMGIEPKDVVPETVGLGKAEDVANLVLYLASDESSFVNGAELVIDNAISIQ